MRPPIDMADALATWLRSQGHDAVPTPLPDDFESRLPITLLTTLGGRRTWPVLDMHRLQVETYGETIADALDEARAVFAAIESINDTHPLLGGVQSYKSETGGLPAESDDPNHPDVPVAAFVAQVSCRSLETE